MTEQPRTAVWNEHNPDWWQMQVESRGEYAWAWLVNEWEARPAVASEGLRAALERLSDMHEAGATTEAVWQYAWEQARAALAAAPAEDHSEEHWHRGPSQSCSICKFAAPVGLDVERLARALLPLNLPLSWNLLEMAAAIAAAYDAAGEGEK